MIKLLVVAIFFILIDLYVFQGVSLLLKNIQYPISMGLKIAFWIINFFVLYKALNITLHFRDIAANQPEYFRFWSGVLVIAFMTKVSFIFFHLLGDVFYGGERIANVMVAKIQGTDSNTISRGTFLTKLGIGVAALFFTSFTYGVVKGRYAFSVMREKISFDNLPKAFSGLKIVQISDLHLGSFVKDFDEVKKAITLINEQEPDYIFFTGDMVNSHSSEAEAWIEIFAGLEAKEGKYSIFGNHDYADYGPYSPQEKIESVTRLKQIHAEMGFTLLEDENLYLEKDGEKIALAGMHNWGKDFHRIGNLENTLQGLKEDDFKILLSHDPSLWEEHIMNKKSIDLTLAGHTHGMQMGFEIPYFNFKWSPAKLRYKRWAGLYKEQKSHLYINRGFGYLGYPGRVGIKPEITVLELVSEKA